MMLSEFNPDEISARFFEIGTAFSGCARCRPIAGRRIETPCHYKARIKIIAAIMKTAAARRYGYFILREFDASDLRSDNH